METVRDKYALPAVVTVASLVQQARFTRRVGIARMKYEVPVPETTGADGFVRVFRAHQNCVEFFPLALSSMWLSSVYCHPVAASVLGVVYIYGRQRYFDGYSESSEKRLPGFKISIRALLCLLAMSGAGTTTALLRRYGDIDLAAHLSRFITSIFHRA